MCALGRRSEAAEAQAAFVRAHDDPQLRARVEASCAGTGSSTSGDRSADEDTDGVGDDCDDVDVTITALDLA